MESSYIGIIPVAHCLRLFKDFSWPAFLQVKAWCLQAHQFSHQWIWTYSLVMLHNSSWSVQLPQSQPLIQTGTLVMLQWVSEWLSLMAFLGHQGPCKLCNHNLFIGIIIFTWIISLSLCNNVMQAGWQILSKAFCWKKKIKDLGYFDSNITVVHFYVCNWQ